MTTLIQFWNSWDDEFAQILSVISCSIIAASMGAYVLLAGKQHGRTAVFRRAVFRCFAAQVRRPSLAFRVSAALIGIGAAYVAYYRVLGDPVPAGSRLLIGVGMVGTIAVGVCPLVVRMVRRSIRQPRQPAFAQAQGPVPLGESGGLVFAAFDDDTQDFVITGFHASPAGNDQPIDRGGAAG